MQRTVEVAIEQGNITTYETDVVTLKYAQHFYGADKAVAAALRRVKVPDEDLQPPVGNYRYLETQGSIKAPFALFLGVVPLREFRYLQIQEFSLRILQILADEAPGTRHIAMTIHGPGFGLDEAESCRAQFAGCVEALQAGAIPAALERITFVDILEERAQRFRATIDQLLENADYAAPVGGRWGYRLVVGSPDQAEEKNTAIASVIPQVGVLSETKPHAFVAMPFKKEMDDVFYYGIQQPVHTIGLLCERVDKSAFTGGIMEYVKNRIETAAVVIAELTDANPNVYLEVGYAWGRGRPTILLVKNEQALLFDVRGQKCLVYERIKDLETALAAELRGMMVNGTIGAQVNHVR